MPKRKQIKRAKQQKRQNYYYYSCIHIKNCEANRQQSMTKRFALRDAISTMNTFFFVVKIKRHSGCYCTFIWLIFMTKAPCSSLLCVPHIFSSYLSCTQNMHFIQLIFINTQKNNNVIKKHQRASKRKTRTNKYRNTKANKTKRHTLKTIDDHDD